MPESPSSDLRYQAALLRVGADSGLGFTPFLERVLDLDAAILGVERVSFWRFTEDGNGIRCEKLYSGRDHTFASGPEFDETRHPAYFRALREDLIIAAADAWSDPRTHQFRDDYLIRHGIRSMLDVPVWVNGRLAGVVCHEHVGEVRSWRSEEQAFALSIGQFISMGIEREQRRLAEKALQEARERLAIVFDSAPDVMMIALDDAGQILAGEERVKGFWAEELAGKDHSILYPQSEVDLGRPEHALRLAVQNGLHREEGWLVRKDGSRFWARTTFRPLFADDGALRGFATIVQDLTAQQLARENRRLLDESLRSAEKQRLLATLSSEIAASLSTQRILPRAAALLVESFAEECAIHLGDSRLQTTVARAIVARDEDRERKLLGISDALVSRESWGDAVVKLLDDGTPILASVLDESFLFRLSEEDGIRRLMINLLPASLIIVPIRARARVLGSLALLRHDMQRPFGADDLELAGEFAQRIAYAVDNARLYALARESIRTRDDFLSVAAHELRTPLTTLKLQLQLVERDCQQGPPRGARASGHFDAAHRQVRRLALLVHELLEVSKLSGGALHLHREPTDLSSLVREVVDAFQDEAARLGSTLNVRVEPEVLGRWDPGRMEQVVTNLLSNAIKYGQGQPIEVELHGTSEEATLVVRDRGMGIAPEDQQRIFGRFERVASSRHFGGLGLGLFIVRRIVDAHHGEILVRSEPGGGSVFEVHLPRWTAEDAREHVDLAGAPPASQELH